MKRSTKIVAVLLLTAHGLLIALSVPKNSVTIDEYMHLPIGVSYWELREFWGYHHNPPLTRLVAAIPAVLADVPTNYRNFYYTPHDRRPDEKLGRDFMLANQHQYMRVFIWGRLAGAGFSVLAGWVVFRWARQLFGESGGLLSLALWAFCPNVLAHAGLVTPDVGSTALGLLATYVFWRYLQAPSLRGAVFSGVLLGLTIGAKFSFVILPAIWVVLAGMRLRQLTCRRAVGHAVIVLAVSLLVVNNLYLFEGTGRTLGSFDLRSNSLTQEKPERQPSEAPRVNRFRRTLWESFPVPLPEHFVLGFDDQLHDVDSGRFYKYLRGDLRQDDGWWYYYLYCIAVKTPVGTLLILLAASIAIWLRQYRSSLFNEACLLLPPLVFLVTLSSQTGLNSHLRYVLPAYPFAFVWAGRLGRSSRAVCYGLAVVIAANFVSVVRVHPHYLAYFNEPAGGPANAIEHLADSNIDWGQGLIPLKEWLAANAPGERIYLAYFGNMDPGILGFEYDVPPTTGPVPGLHAIGANFLAGVPWSVPSGPKARYWMAPEALTYYRRCEPVATPGWSIYVYDLSLEDCNRVRRELGLPLLSE